MERIYYDNAATTYVDKEVLDVMLPFLTEKCENPSGLYSGGAYVRKCVNEARHSIASHIGSFDKEIIFTAGGSEADNMALIGTAFANKEKGRHIITTNIEHHAILKSAKFLEENGFRVTYVPVNENGIVELKDIEKAICRDTILISVMYVNNEIGTIQPIKEICRLAHEKGILFHTDAVQAFGRLPIKVSDLQADLISVSAHKFHGPKGVGFLYVKNGTNISPLIQGGSQEYGLRAGTENVAGIVAMAKAIERAEGCRTETLDTETKIKAHITERLTRECSGIIFNGDREKSVPGILNFSVEKVEGESLLIMLDMKGISASTGSACTQSYRKPSHVIRALEDSESRAKSSIRFSFCKDNTLEEADRAVDILLESIEYLRKIRVPD